VNQLYGMELRGTCVNQLYGRNYAERVNQLYGRELRGTCVNQMYGRNYVEHEQTRYKERKCVEHV